MVLIGHEYIGLVVLLQLENYIMKDTKKINNIISVYFTISMPSFATMALIFILPNRFQIIVYYML